MKFRSGAGVGLEQGDWKHFFFFEAEVNELMVGIEVIKLAVLSLTLTSSF